MSGFLAQMAQASRRRAKEAAAREPLPAIRARAVAVPDPPPLSLMHSFELIAEYKRNSPALGPLAEAAEPLERQVTAYARGGAAAVSVLTEPERFDGEIAHVTAAAVALAPLSVPVLRKDFLVDPWQLYESRAAGAGGVLLIVRMLPGGLLSEMLDCALALRLFVLLEAFDAADLARIAFLPRSLPAAGRANDMLIGVNCRDLETLEVVPFRCRELAPLLPSDLPCVAESGIASPEQCAEAARAGYGAALVGGSLMRAADPLRTVRAMLAAGRDARAAA
ncbi:MAG: indole-3-glycerol phosphate synthase TrpC [Gammaproteobacteria bacterium]